MYFSKSKLMKSIKIIIVSIFLGLFGTLSVSNYPEFHGFVDPGGNEVILDEPNTEAILLDNMAQMKSDYEKVKEINPEIIGWIYSDGIVYTPVMNSGDNEKYLRQDYKGNYAKRGEVFMSKASQGSFDDVSLLYGHNMNDGAMFGRLKLLRGKENFQKHKELIVYDGTNFKVYSLFSIFSHIDGTRLFEKKGLEGDSRVEYFSEISSKSTNKPSENPDLTQDIIFLQTCYTAVGLNRDVAVYAQTRIISGDQIGSEV